MRAGRPSNGTCSRASRTQLVTMRLSGNAASSVIVDLADVVRIVGQRHPAERADGAGEQRPQKGLGEDRDIEGVLDAALSRLGADEIAVVEHDGAGVP